MYQWCWDTEHSSNNVIVDKRTNEVIFHPNGSHGTEVIRGNTCFKKNEEYYWEIQIRSRVYGTDIMFGVGTAFLDLNKYKDRYCSPLGKDRNGWGLSYHGTLHHNGIITDYTTKLESGSIIGLHLDMNKGTLTFYKDEISLGIAFNGLFGQQLYPMISSTAARTRLRLLGRYKSTFSLQYLCCKEIIKSFPYVPPDTERHISWRLKWLFKRHHSSETP